MKKLMRAMLNMLLWARFTSQYIRKSLMRDGVLLFVQQRALIRINECNMSHGDYDRIMQVIMLHAVGAESVIIGSKMSSLINST